MNRIYLDYAATTPLCEEAFVAMKPYFSSAFGNADSVHSFGREGEKGLLAARDAIADLVGAQSDEIYFTSGGTEADNFALKGAAAASDKRHMVISGIEHPAVRAAAGQLRNFGFEVTEVAPDREGFVSPDSVREAIREDTLLVSVMWANNVFGTLQDIPALVSAAHDGGALFHTDAVQAAGALEVTADCGADMISFSAHRGLRGGTSNVAGAVGFAAAFGRAVKNREEETGRLRLLRDAFYSAVKACDGVRPVGASDFSRRHPGNLCLRVEGVTAEQLIVALDMRGVAVSAGSACSARQSEPDGALMALGMTRQEARECVRISFGKDTSPSDVEEAAAAFADAVNRLSRKR